MSLLNQIVSLIPGAPHKTLVQIGAYDDTLAAPLAGAFKSVACLSSQLRSTPYTSGNLIVDRAGYLDILADFHRYDVVVIENAFHHFPDLWQMWTYERLGRYQELLLVEWDFTGNAEPFYRAFQNRAPLCQLTREILSRFLGEGEIVIEAALKGRYTAQIRARSELLDYFRYILPEHYPFGEKDFLRRTGGLTYPLELWEGFDLFKVRRFDYV